MTAAPTDVRLVLVTAPPGEPARLLARRLVDLRLVACVNVVPGITSVYRYEGRVHEDPEELLVMKTSAARLDDLRRAVLELHPYDVPEFVAWSPADVAPRYAEWLLDAVRPGASDGGTPASEAQGGAGSAEVGA